MSDWETFHLFGLHHILHSFEISVVTQNSNYTAIWPTCRMIFEKSESKCWVKMGQQIQCMYFPVCTFCKLCKYILCSCEETLTRISLHFLKRMGARDIWEKYNSPEEAKKSKFFRLAIKFLTNLWFY